jgi:3-methylcrotonyl-CoA carboxylase alpha subunit
MSWRVVEVGGKRRRFAVARGPKGVWVGWRGGAALVEKEQVFASQAGRDRDVRAPMTGKVVQVKVKPGDRVEADQLLVVLEAMKMELRLTSPKAGIVATVGCKEGELVDQGSALVMLAE